MPLIIDLVPMPDGRMGIVLDVPPTPDDPGSVELWTGAERKAMVKRVREACASLAEMGDPDDEANQWHPTSQMGEAGKKIAALIRSQNEE
jgi:hypothetical protein